MTADTELEDEDGLFHWLAFVFDKDSGKRIYVNGELNGQDEGREVLSCTGDLVLAGPIIWPNGLHGELASMMAVQEAL